MRKFLSEFREFINRGNVVDLAVAVIIGGAFTGIVTSLADNIISPLIAVIAGGGADQISGLVIPGTEIDFGALLSAVINFLIVALVVFLLVKAVNKAQSLGGSLLGANKGKDEKEKPLVCPFCLEEIKEGATRCPHCTGVLPEPARPRKA